MGKNGRFSSDWDIKPQNRFEARKIRSDADETETANPLDKIKEEAKDVMENAENKARNFWQAKKIGLANRIGSREIVARDENEQWTMDSIAEYSAQLAELVKYYVRNPQAPRVSILRQNLSALMQNSALEQHKYCGADRAFDVIDVDGRRYPCHFLSPLALIGARLKQLRDENFTDEAKYIDDRCRMCMLRNVCPTCAGSNYALTGSLQNRDLTHCRIFATDVVFNARLQYELLSRKAELDSCDYETLRAVREITRAVRVKFKEGWDENGAI